MADRKTFIPFSQIIGQEKAITFLKRVMARDKIPHAYLFVGITGVGKTTTAMAFTQAINCQAPVNETGCGQCQQCRQIMGGNFPDLERLKPDGQYIKIEQVRELNRTFSFKPVSGRYRVSIIQKAERMTEEASNAFLKTLEEPPGGNILILCVTEPLDLLPTIVSRCQQVSFNPIPFHLISARLKESRDMDAEKALVLAKISEGSLGRALEMCEEAFLEKRQDDIYNIINLPGLSPERAMDMALDYTGRHRKNNSGTKDKKHGGISGLLAIWETWYRDLLLLKVKGPEDLLINQDFSHQLKKISGHSKIDHLINSIMLLDHAQRDVRKARNLDLMMENAILKLKRLSG